MDLERRLTELERRLAALESTPAPPLAASAPAGDDFWALEGLKTRLSDEPGAGDGEVLYTGAVRLPTGAQYEWQHGLLTEHLLEIDWADAAETFAALGHAMRLRLLREILGGRHTATELAGLDDVGTSGQIYHHLRQLTAAGWLRQAGRGRYEIPEGRVVPLLVALATTRPV